MVQRAFIAALCGIALWLAAPIEAEAAPADQLADRVAKLEKHRSGKVAEQAKLEMTLSRQNGEVSVLKRKRSSWRRNRELKRALKASRATADQLSALHKQIRAGGKKLAKARKALVKAANIELATQRNAARRAVLLRLRKRAMAKLKPRSKKIVLPNDAIDPLADETELREQAALLDRAMKELEREEALLTRREDRYQKMARLQKSRARADEAALFDDNRPRRTTSRQAGPDNRGAGANDGADFSGQGAPETSDDADPGGITGDADGPPDLGFDSDPAVVLVEVVDADTIDALRHARRSDDPKVKAKAAKRARDQVKTKRERLERQRKKIEARIRAMKNK